MPFRIETAHIFPRLLSLLYKPEIFAVFGFIGSVLLWYGMVVVFTSRNNKVFNTTSNVATPHCGYQIVITTGSI